MHSSDHDVAALKLGHAVRRALTPYVSIGAGAALGANARFVLGIGVSTLWGDQFPVATLLINVSGSFAVGIYLTIVTERFSGHEAARLFVATGFLGSYTTFSTFSVEALRLVESGDPRAALVYVVASAALSIVAAMIGILLAHALLSRSQA